MRKLVTLFLSYLLPLRLAHANNWTFNLTEGVTPISHDIYDLHMTVFWVCVGIGIIVFSAMTYSIFFHRKSPHKKPATFHTVLHLEIAWTIIPFLILVILAIPGTRVLSHMNNYEMSDLTIKVTGYQWKWRYDYLDQNINYFSNLSTPLSERMGKQPKNINYLREVDHPLVVPIHKKVRFLVTSNDVLHSWWVPDLGIKREAVPGYINETWARINRPGIYYGQCAELCGLNHAYMPIVVIALSEKEFADWIAKQKGELPVPTAPTAPSIKAPTQTSALPATAAPAAKKYALEELMKQGEQVYQRTCTVCHQATGEGLPPTFPPLKGSALVKGPVPKHIDRVLNGKIGTAMQAFKDQLTDIELAAVITYERNAWGNNMGDAIQPEQIKAARNNQGAAP